MCGAGGARAAVGLSLTSSLFRSIREQIPEPGRAAVFRGE